MMKVWVLLLLTTPVAFAIPTPIGHPNKGLLRYGQSLHKLIAGNSEILKSVSPKEYQFGSAEMARVLLAIGNWAKEFKRAPVWIGDISLKPGGKFAKHITHQRGLDADIGYLVREHKLEGHRSKKFHARFTEQFGVNGELSENFDLEANYGLFKRIVSETTYDALYVGCAIYDALEKRDKTEKVSIMDQIYAQKGHEDHFHMRIKCPADRLDCSDKWWRDPAKPVTKKSDEKPRAKFRDC
ncbi:MAG: penicillin-insensitive murein endopeptidase [Bdellovibrionia bacterium]